MEWQLHENDAPCHFGLRNKGIDNRYLSNYSLWLPQLTRSAFISIDTQQKDISQTSPVEELSCVEPIQTFQGHEANKRNWSERQRSEENISPTETATQKRRRVSISKTINDSSLAISTKGPTSQSNDRDVSNPPKQMNKGRL
jgi:hypothetical protein